MKLFTALLYGLAITSLMLLDNANCNAAPNDAIDLLVAASNPPADDFAQPPSNGYVPPPSYGPSQSYVPPPSNYAPAGNCGAPAASGHVHVHRQRMRSYASVSTQTCANCGRPVRQRTRSRAYSRSG